MNYNYYIIYYSTHADIVRRTNKPEEADYPEASYAEGPFDTQNKARIRLRWVRGQY